MTKFLIVACAVVCLLLAALTVAYSANADRIVDSLASERAQRLATEATASATLADAGNERAEFNRQIQALNAEIQKRDSAIASLQSERTTLMAEKERAMADAAGVKNQTAQLTATVQTQSAVIDGYRDELTKLRSEQLSAARREIDLADRVNDLTSQREVLEQNVRALREQLAEVQLAMQTAASGVKPGAAGQPFDPVGLSVRGTVIDVIKSPNGDDLAVIDIGSNRGLQKQMRLNIIRGGEFLAILEIMETQPGQAVGRINTLGKTIQVNKGDTITSQLQRG